MGHYLRGFNPHLCLVLLHGGSSDRWRLLADMKVLTLTGEAVCA